MQPIIFDAEKFGWNISGLHVGTYKKHRGSQPHYLYIWASRARFPYHI